MVDNEKRQLPYKVFFIVSNKSTLNDKIEYSLKRNGMINFQKVFSKPIKHKMVEFTSSVYSFDIIQGFCNNEIYNNIN